MQYSSNKNLYVKICTLNLMQHLKSYTSFVVWPKLEELIEDKYSSKLGNCIAQIVYKKLAKFSKTIFTTQSSDTLSKGKGVDEFV